VLQWEGESFHSPWQNNRNPLKLPVLSQNFTICRGYNTREREGVYERIGEGIPFPDAVIFFLYRRFMAIAPEDFLK